MELSRAWTYRGLCEHGGWYVYGDRHVWVVLAVISRVPAVFYCVACGVLVCVADMGYMAE